jgi:CPA2 family monovalent cation:H+ antiporter-2
MPDSALFLRDLAVVLAIAATVTLSIQRLRLPMLVGYLVAGILIGPGLPITLVTDEERIRTLADLGVSLLMFSIGLDFGLRKLLRQGPRVALTALIEVVVLFTFGMIAARLLGWSLQAQLFAGGAVACTSTMIVTRVIAEAPPERRLRDLVLGLSIVEDLIGMLLIAALTAVALGQQVSGELLGQTLLRLAVFLVTVLGFGLLLVPRLIRSVAKLQRPELLLLTAVGLCFVLASLAQFSGHSLALGAFLAGFLVNESGLGREVRDMVRPLRHLFGALFFVAVGMLFIPTEALALWPAVVAFVVVVTVGNILGVGAGAFLAGFGVRTSVQASLYMGQVGEFTFIIAGLATIAGLPEVFPVMVAVSIITATLSSFTGRNSEALAAWVDARLPRQLQTYASLYSSWIETLAHRPPHDAGRNRVRRMARLLALDAAALSLIVLAAGLFQDRASALLGAWVSLAPEVARLAVLAGASILAVPVLAGVFATTRRMATVLAERAMPPVEPGQVDPAYAPRRVLRQSLLIGIVLASLGPVVLVTLPVIPAYGGPSVLIAVLVVLFVALWRAARDLREHARAGAELIVHALARQSGGADEAELLDRLQKMLPGLGTLVPVRLEASSPACGRTLGELNLRGRTGATIVAIVRNGEKIVNPEAGQRIEPGDLLALTGSKDAIHWARGLLEVRPAR